MSAAGSVAVVGAGPMGLACAYRLAKAGHRVTVYEAGPVPGGMSASFDFDGLEIERYYHFICSTDHPLFDALAELGLQDRLRWRETRMGFYYEGKLYPWGSPEKLLLFPHLDLLSKLRYAAHVMYAEGVKDWRALDREEATAWIRRWIGERGYAVLWEPLFRLKFFEHSQRLSAAWIGTRIQRVARSRKNVFSERLGYLEGGSKVLVEAYCREIERLGGRIVLGAPVRQIVVDDGAVAGINIGGATEPCAAAISTVPLKYVPLMVPALSHEERNRIAAIENIGVVCVILKLRRQLTPFFWTNVNDRTMEIPGFIEYTNLNPLGPHIVYFPFYLPKSHPKWERDGAAFIDEVKGYLRQIAPDLQPEDLLAAHASRYEFAQTVYTPGFYETLPPMRTSVRNFFMADTAYYYPEDRSISESVRVGAALARHVDDAA